jgi:hypothetical protein
MFVYIYGLISNVIRNLNYIQSNEWMTSVNNELERMWKEEVMA